MFLYSVIGVLYAIFALIARSKDRKTCFIALVPLFVIVAFKDLSVGNDTLNYFKTFTGISYCNTFADALQRSRMEIGFVFVNFVLSKLGFSYFMFQVAVSSFIFISLYIFLRNYSENAFLSVYIFYIFRMMFSCMVAMRVWIAISVLMYSITALREKKIKKFILLCIIASTFHTTAILFVFIYPITIASKRKKGYMYYLIICMVLSAIGKPFFTLLTNEIGKYQGYVDSEYFNSTNKTAAFFTLLIDVCFLVLYYLTYIKDKETTDIQSDSIAEFTLEKIYLSALFIGIGLDLIGLNNNIMDRLSIYFRFLLIISIPYMFNNIKGKNGIITRMIILLFLFIQFWIVMYFRPQWNNVIPYRFFFNN